MTLKSEKDIKKAVEGKAGTVACICKNCGLPYTVSIKTLKATNALLCRKCYASLRKKKERHTSSKEKKENQIIVKKPAHIKEFRKRGFYYNKIYFDSSWKLAYYIWLTDNKKKFIYKPDMPLTYKDASGVDREYYPDFLVEGHFVEIKGDQFFNEKDEPYNLYKKEFWWEKYNALIKNNVYILREKEAFTYVKYVNERYGKDFLKQRKIF